MTVRRRTRCTGQRGSVSVFVVVMVPALLAGAGLVLDGGRQLEARRSAHGAAQAAARAAAQGSDDEVIGGAIDPDLALARAQAELALHGASGSAALVDGRIVVTVTASVDYLVLPGGKSITETATADPQAGIEGSRS
jgi:Flp pilus assembly protein TadG